MAILIIVATVAAGMIYLQATRPCLSKRHWHRHLRFRHHRGRFYS